MISDDVFVLLDCCKFLFFALLIQFQYHCLRRHRHRRRQPQRGRDRPNLTLSILLYLSRMNPIFSIHSIKMSNVLNSNFIK